MCVHASLCSGYLCRSCLALVKGLPLFVFVVVPLAVIALRNRVGNCTSQQPPHARRRGRHVLADAAGQGLCVLMWQYLSVNRTIDRVGDPTTDIAMLPSSQIIGASTHTLFHVQCLHF